MSASRISAHQSLFNRATMQYLTVVASLLALIQTVTKAACAQSECGNVQFNFPQSRRVPGRPSVRQTKTKGELHANGHGCCQVKCSGGKSGKCKSHRTKTLNLRLYARRKAVRKERVIIVTCNIIREFFRAICTIMLATETCPSPNYSEFFAPKSTVLPAELPGRIPCAQHIILTRP
jgi:hypothetical protein